MAGYPSALRILAHRTFSPQRQKDFPTTRLTRQAKKKKTRELPEKISPGDELEVQLAPIGDWPNVDADGSPLTQSVDGEAVDRMVANFAGDILVDADHQSESGGSTEALAWVTAFRADPERGLVGTMRFTDVILGFFALERNGNGVCQHFSCPICPISVVRAMWSTMPTR